MFLFGAGASYGAGNVRPKPPPLGSQLYKELARKFPMSWGMFPQELRSQFDENFERGMGVLWDSGSHASPLLMQQMAVYFSEFFLPNTREDSYSKLIDSLVPLGTIGSSIFSTLNYDCLLECALTMAGRKVVYFNETATDSHHSNVWKLHGSCNFIPEGISATRGVTFGSGVKWGANLRAANTPQEVRRFCYGNTALYPALAIYTKDKPIQIAPEIILRIQNWWTNAIAQSSQIVVVGVNPNPDDDHIWNPIAASPSRLVYVGNEKAFSDWSSEYRESGESIYLGNLFDQCISGIVDELQ